MSLQSLAADLQDALAAFLPDGCACRVAWVSEATLTDLSTTERSCILSWAPHRQAEFATGRQCARSALAQVGASAVSLLPDGDGVPEWPLGYLGSISHSRGLVAAVAAPADACALLGLDLEKTNRLSEAAIRRVQHPAEADFVAGDRFRASILFSLKEAFYKAQFPLWRTVGNFENLALEVDLAAGCARILEIDARFDASLRGMELRFQTVADYVVSLCRLR